MKKVLFILLAVISLTSCNSLSAEKVVVLTADYNMTTRMYKYKVKRISKGAVDFIEMKNLYAVGDTLLFRSFN